MQGKFITKEQKPLNDDSKIEINAVSKNNWLTFNSYKHYTKHLEEMNIYNITQQ